MDMNTKIVKDTWNQWSDTWYEKYRTDEAISKFIAEKHGWGIEFICDDTMKLSKIENRESILNFACINDSP